MQRIFANRRQAGRILGKLVQQQCSVEGDAIVLALPRGGVPVAAEIATMIDADLDILVVRKIGLPGHQELAMGAIASGGVRVLNNDVIAVHGIDNLTVDAVAKIETAELERRQREYRGDRPLPVLQGRQVFLVDDGLATGATMNAAIVAVRKMKPSHIIVAVPVAAADTAARLRASIDALICPLEPRDFFAIGQFYSDFGQTSDDEVKTLLQQAWTRP